VHRFAGSDCVLLGHLRLMLSMLWNEELLENVEILTAGTLVVGVAVLGTTVLGASNLQCFATL
jgi:hypothetical protein